MTALGYVMVGDLGRFEISRLYLEDGLLWMIAISDVVRFAGGKCMVRFYSPDGKVAGIVGELPIAAWDLGPNPGTVSIQFSVRLESALPEQPYMTVVDS